MLPNELIDFAWTLVSGGASEVALRSAVSRAYYGALHACDEALPSEYSPSREQLASAGSHRAIISAMEVWGRKPGAGRGDAQVAARALSKLKLQRVQADYKITEEWSIDAKSCLQLAAEVVVLAASAVEKRRLETSGEQAGN